VLLVVKGVRVLHRATTYTFGERTLIQRCREHKRRNVADPCPNEC
jgi:hypothetical protein